MNRLIWEQWDWTGLGEEWTYSEEWKSAVMEDLLDPNVPVGSRVVEIGPGAGRWTSRLMQRAASLVALDLSRTSVALCRERFGTERNARFEVTDGRTLPGVEDRSVDVVWSFDVFVHLSPRDTEVYLFEIARVLAPGGRAVIHHGSIGGESGGWRSGLTLDAFDRATAAAGLAIGNRRATVVFGGGSYPVGRPGDVVSVLRLLVPPRIGGYEAIGSPEGVG